MDVVTGFLRPPRYTIKHRPMPFNKEWATIGPKSVLQPLQTLPLLVNRYCTDTNGTVIAKGALPAAMQVKYPVFFLGDFDRMGSFRTGLKVIPPIAGTVYVQSFVNGNGATPFDVIGGPNPFADIQSLLNPGDIVIVYSDSLTAPNFYVWLAIQGTYQSMASVIGNSATTQQDGRIGPLNVDYINLYIDNATMQIYEPLHFTRLFNTGTFRDDSVNPSMFKTPFNRLRNLITLSTTFEIDQYIGINFYMGFDVDQVQMDLILKRV